MMSFHTPVDSEQMSMLAKVLKTYCDERSLQVGDVFSLSGQAPALRQSGGRSAPVSR